MGCKTSNTWGRQGLCRRKGDLALKTFIASLFLQGRCRNADPLLPDTSTRQTYKHMGSHCTFMLVEQTDPSSVTGMFRGSFELRRVSRSPGKPLFELSPVAACPGVQERTKSIPQPCSISACCSEVCNTAGKRGAVPPGLTWGWRGRLHCRAASLCSSSFTKNWVAHNLTW